MPIFRRIRPRYIRYIYTYPVLAPVVTSPAGTWTVSYTVNINGRIMNDAVTLNITDINAFCRAGEEGLQAAQLKYPGATIAVTDVKQNFSPVATATRYYVR